MSAANDVAASPTGVASFPPYLSPQRGDEDIAGDAASSWAVPPSLL